MNRIFFILLPLAVLPLAGVTEGPARAPTTFPRAARFGEGVVVDGTALKPYAHLLQKGDAEAFARAARTLTGGELFAVVQGIAKAFADAEQETQRFQAQLQTTGSLLNTTGGLADSLLFGTYPGSGLPRVPRLVTGVFVPASPSTPPEAWLYEHPERACTAAFASAPLAQAADLGDLEALHGSAELPRAQLDALLNIAASPDPLGEAIDPPALPGEMLAVGEGDDGAGLALLALDDAILGVVPEGPEEPLQKRLQTGEMPLVTYLDEVGRLPAFATTADTPERMRALLKRLVPIALTAAQSCVAPNRVRAVGHSDDGLRLFDCQTPSGRRIGIAARLIGPGLMPSRLAIAYHDTDGRGAELVVDDLEQSLTLAMQRDERYHGPSLTWSLDGRLAALAWRAADEADVEKYDVFEWHPNGAPRLLAHRIGGRASGDEATWFPDGAPASVVTYGMTGELVAYKAWFPSGAVADELKTENGVVMRRLWHPNGKPAAEVPFANGQPQGRVTLSYDNGTVGISATYAAGELAGETRWFYEDGRPLFRGTFAAGVADGTERLFRPSGEPLSERTYRRGVPSGKWVAFDATGKPVRELAFAEGQREGTARIRYTGGQPLLEMPFQGGQLHGDLTAYYPGGAKATTCTYLKGDLVRFTRWTADGRVDAISEPDVESPGAQTVTLRRVDGKPFLTCRAVGAEIDGCQVFGDGGGPLATPSAGDLADEATGKALKWKPDDCGGADATWRFRDLIDGGGDRVTVSFETMDACTDGLAEVLNCTLRITGDRFDAERCELGRFHLAH